MDSWGPYRHVIQSYKTVSLFKVVSFYHAVFRNVTTLLSGQKKTFKYIVHLFIQKNDCCILTSVIAPPPAGNSSVHPPPLAYHPLKWSRDTSLTDFQKVLRCDSATGHGEGYTGMRRITTDRIYDGSPIIL